jgi:hypothetical protein
MVGKAIQLSSLKIAFLRVDELSYNKQQDTDNGTEIKSP